MERNKLIGLIICIFFIITGFVINGNVAIYFNLVAFLIVLGGTFGAAFLSFRMERLSIVYKVLRASYQTEVKTPKEIVEILVDLSVKRRIKGVLSLQGDQEETSIMFLRRSLGFLVDGYTKDQIKEILTTEMYFFKFRREESERVLRTIAELCPSFGLIGSIVGLIGMLAGVGDSSVILKTIPIALTSTLYGVILANFFLLPFAAHMRERTDQELLLQKIILEGVVAIKSELGPRVLEMKLKSFLTPSSRQGRIISLKRIQKLFKIWSDDYKPGTVDESAV